MKKVGLLNNQTYTDLDQLLRFFGYVIPIVLILYGLMLKFDIIAPQRTLSWLELGLIIASWIGLAIYHEARRDDSSTNNAIKLIAFHLISSAYVLLVSGLNTPLIFTWSILLLASYNLFAVRGVFFSIMMFFVTALMDSMMLINRGDHILLNLFVMLTVLVLGTLAVEVVRMQQRDRLQLGQAKKKSLQQKDQIISLINSLADAVISTDSKGVVGLYNSSTLSLLDTNLDLVGKPIDSILKIHDDRDKKFYLSKQLQSLRGPQVRDDLTMTVSGEDIKVSIVLSPVRDINGSDSTKSTGFIFILRDITKQKTLEEQRDEFISVISHELRTPITITEATISNLKIMLERKDIPPATIQTNVSTAHDQILFLARLINDLSTLGHIERGTDDEAEEVDLNDFVNQIYQEHMKMAHEKNLSFDLDIDPSLGTVFASRIYLKELVQNLITNAIKYTKKGSILVSAKKDSRGIRIAIKDTGIGISKSDQKLIYKRFFRSEDYRTRETGGTGLGLYVAHKLASKLNTNLELDSRLNYGSTFSFYLKKHDQSSLNSRENS